MSKRTEEYLKNVPMKSYDVLLEGLVVLVLATVIVVILAAVFRSPDYPTVRGEDVANLQPIAFLKTSADILAGNHGVQTYGPPYTSDTDNAQNVLGVAPANWFGVTTPVDATTDLVLRPLQRVAILNSDVAGALQEYQAASPDQQQTWVTAYLDGLDQATATNDQVSIPTGDYGPVPTMMNGMLALGRAGLLEGALDSSSQSPYSLNYTKSLLFFQDDVDAAVADTLNMKGDQWGVSNETGRFPGAWWLWPYAFLYQIPPMSSSPNADLEAIGISAAALLLLLLLPFIPIIRGLPRRVGIHRLIWRDWYHRSDGGGPRGSGHRSGSGST